MVDHLRRNTILNDTYFFLSIKLYIYLKFSSRNFNDNYHSSIDQFSRQLFEIHKTFFLFSMAERQVVNVSDTEKLENAKIFKSEGNECHKNKDFKKAIGKYHRALLQLKAIGQAKSSGLSGFLTDEEMEARGYSSNISPETQAEVMKLMSDCYNNLAACLLQQDNPNYKKILDYGERVTELAPQNIKGFYRQGLAHYNLKNFEKGLECFNQAASISKDSKDQAFKALLAKQMVLCKEGIKEQDKQLKEAYKGMFNRTKGGGHTT